MCERPFYERPCAAEGLVSYRYRGRYGWIMIGARDDHDALFEARRSTGAECTRDRLQVWRGDRYVEVQ